MKKATRFLSATVLAMFLLSFCFLFAGCSAKIEGTYKFSSMSFTEEVSGGVSVDVTVNVGEKYDDEVLTEDYYVITLNEDGSAVFYEQNEMIMNYFTGESYTYTNVQVGTWVNGADKTIALTFDGSSISCKYDGKTLSFEYFEDGAPKTMTLKKK